MRRVIALAGHRTTRTVLFHVLAAAVAYVMAFALRFDLDIPERYVRLLGLTLPLLLVCKLIGFSTFRLFSGWWQHVTLYDVADIARGNVLGSVLFLVVMVLTGAAEGFPRSVFLLDLLLCTALVAGARAARRLVHERQQRSTVRRVDKLVLIAGAGSAGIQLLQEIQSRPHLRLGVVGFADDDRGKAGLRIAGGRVLGRLDDIPSLVARHEVEEVLIAMPSVSGTVLRRVVQCCRQAGVRHRVLPTLSELVEGRVMYTQIRDVKLDDLLARQPVHLDLPRLRSFITGKRVLVTGAAGSIGSELCRQLAAHRPAQLILYDRHENGLHTLEHELRSRYTATPLAPVLGDVLLEDQLRSVFALYRPDAVFHAAAYKHLPLAELNVIEAARNNVLGTDNVARAAAAHGTKEFVLVSTDKAVRPTSVMGVTKRLAEMVIQTPAGAGPRFVAVRFGNVLGSNGSVVPLFREQIARGGPVTVTDPQVTRYFMTIPEAAQLILQAAALGRHGDILVLDMGQPVRILDLARHMIKLSGLEPHEDIDIVFTGLRPGEKLHEELVADGEEVTPTPHDRIRVLRPPTVPAPPEDWISTLQAHVQAGDVAATILLIRRLVPGYQPSDLVAGAPAVPGVVSGPRTDPLPAVA
jgi:FlaA1/EpsC-like NDP-sugar epimerase